jgi:hypothetical protein
MFNKVSMVIGALTGQKTVMQYIAGSADTAANATGRLADNAKKSAKAASGALAAFDEINLLQKAQSTTGEGGGGSEAGAGGGAYQFKAVPIDPEVQKNVKTVQDWFQEAWDNIKKWAYEAIVWILTQWVTANIYLQTYVIDPIKNFFKDAWDSISKWAKDSWDSIVKWWNDAGKWFQDNVITPLKEFFTPIWNVISALAIDAWRTIEYVCSLVSGWFQKNVIEPVIKFFAGLWTTIMGYAGTAWQWILGVWQGVSKWFNDNVVEPIKKGFEKALDFVKTKWEDIFSGIRDFVKGIINTMIDYINSFLSGFSSGINNALTGLNKVGSKSIPGWVTIPEYPTLKIPKLATGAVIPPNAAFAAVLGDQRNGTNIETPQKLLEDIIDQKLSEHMGDQQITINFGGSLGALVRELKPFIDKENIRVGNNLVRGGGVINLNP